jgi:hypothetical protein
LAEVISNEEYQSFIDNGTVKKDRIISLATKIIKGDKNFSEREFAIFCQNTTEVNEAIRLLTKKNNTR